MSSSGPRKSQLQDFLHESLDTNSQVRQNRTGTFQTQEHQRNELTCLQGNVDYSQTNFLAFQRGVNTATGN